MSETVQSIDKVVQAILPESLTHSQILKILSESIKTAHETNEAGWSLTKELRRGYINLNTGRILALRIFKHTAFVAISGGDQPQIREIDSLKLCDDEFKGLPGVRLYQIPPGELSSVWDDIRENHFEAIKKASKAVIRTPYFIHHSPELLVYLEKNLNEAFPSPRYEDVPITSPQREKMLSLVRNKYPGWEGFQNQAFIEDEINYKQNTIQKARDLISRDALKRLLQEEKYDTIISSLDKIGKDSNLLYRAVPMSGDLGILYQEKLDKKSFCEEFTELLYGDGETLERFNRYLDWVEHNRLPSKWTFPTYFLFICHPDEEIFVKPRVTRKCFELLGYKLKLRGEPNIDEYSTVKRVAFKLKEAFKDFGVKDLVDIQSLIWLCGRGEGHPLRWRRAKPESYELVLLNPENLDREVLDQLVSRMGGNKGFSSKARKHFSKFLNDPNSPLASEAYVLLSNWFLGEDYGEYESGEPTEHAKKTWDFLFAHRPPNRLSKVDKNHLIIPKRFDEWWALMDSADKDQPNYWIFQSNPDDFDIRESVRTKTLSHFTLSRFRDQIKKGDFVFLWESGSEGGIVGTARTTGYPEQFEDESPDDKYWKPGSVPIKGIKVALKDLVIVDPPISRQTLKNIKVLENLSILRQAQGSNFAVTPAEARILLDLLKDMSLPPVWWVNQGSTYTAEKNGNYMWAPQTGAGGRRIGHHQAMMEVQPGDLVLHYSKGTIKAISTVLSSAQDKTRPDELPVGRWDKNGFFVKTSYQELEKPIELNEIPDSWRKSGGGPFNSKGGVNQGYLFAIEPALASKLIDLFRYRLNIHTNIYTPPSDPPMGKNAFDQILSAIQNEHLYFPIEVVANYLLALQAKRFVILTGISGTGKTKLATTIAQYFRPNKGALENSEIVAVRPDWTDNRGLLGYYNPLTRQYSSTPFLELLMKAGDEVELAENEGREPHPFFVVLDEMNLARVEHYFSDFLSCLESAQALHLHDDISLEQEESEEGPIPRKLKIPSNLFFTGTVNVDETTYMFSPKVLDRAFTIELNQVDLTQLGSGVNEAGENPLDLKNVPKELRPVTNPSSKDWLLFGELEDGNLLDLIVNLNDILAEENRHFGYRVANEIARCQSASKIDPFQRPILTPLG